MSAVIIHAPAAVEAAMRAHGIVPTESVEGLLHPGQFARFAIEGDKPRERSGWARPSEDGQVLSFGSRRTGVKGKWQEPGAQRGRLASADRSAMAQRIAERRQQEDAAAAQARALWDSCSKADDQHPALRSLGLDLLPDGVRECGSSILVPMIDSEFRLRNVLQIYATGIARHPFKGGRRAGLFWAHRIVRRDGRPADKPLVIADRYEAASAIHAPTGLPVVSSMSEGNLHEVARAMRRMFPCREIIVAAHDDRNIDAMPRLRAAAIAAHAIGARLATPMSLNWRATGGKGFEFMPFGDVIERIAAAERIGGAA